MRKRCMKFNPDVAQKSPAPVGAVIVCAGKGERTGLPYNKILHQIGHKTVLETTLDKFICTDVDHITVVAAKDDIERISELTSEYPIVSVVEGGKTRAQSVFAGLKAYPCDIAVIHDGARPFVTPDIISNAISSARRYGSGIAAVPAIDTVKRVSANGKVTSLPRAELFNMQTPQAFRYDEIMNAYSTVSGEFTDDGEVYEKAGYSPRLVEGSYDNVKITTATDLIRTVPSSCKIGIGFDVHRLAENRKLILGGVQIDYDRGLDGHSDADVLTHAIMDALLSAAGLPDIGVLFPDTDDKYLGISSIELLKDVAARIAECGCGIGNISAVIIAQRPKLAPIIYDIRLKLSSTLGIDLSKINVSATTTERLGLIGNGDAIATSASCILTENNK